jgi:hypothetical protein
MIKPLMRNLQQRVEQAKLLHHAQRCAMNGVAAEVSIEVLVLLQHHHIDPLARKEETENDAGRSSADNTHCGVESFVHEHLSAGRLDHAVMFGVSN